MTKLNFKKEKNIILTKEKMCLSKNEKQSNNATKFIEFMTRQNPADEKMLLEDQEINYRKLILSNKLIGPH